jgi:hypothetical protein
VNLALHTRGIRDLVQNIIAATSGVFQGQTEGERCSYGDRSPSSLIMSDENTRQGIISFHLASYRYLLGEGFSKKKEIKDQ